MFDEERRYKVLPVIVGSLRLLSILPLGGGIKLLVEAFQIALNPPAPPLAVGLPALASFVLLLMGVIFLGIAEVLNVLMDIEENTRKAADDSLLVKAEHRRLSVAAGD